MSGSPTPVGLYLLVPAKVPSLEMEAMREVCQSEGTWPVLKARLKSRCRQGMRMWGSVGVSAVGKGWLYLRNSTV